MHGMTAMRALTGRTSGRLFGRKPPDVAPITQKGTDKATSRPKNAQGISLVDVPSVTIVAPAPQKYRAPISRLGFTTHCR